MSDEAMRALIERVEQAQGADRELDALLWCALKGYRLTEHAYGKWTYYVPGAACEGRTADVPAYTASIDAAVSLVPDGWRVVMIVEGPGYWAVKLQRGMHGRMVSGNGKIEQGARMAAALRAQLAMSDAQGQADGHHPEGALEPRT